MEWFNPAVSKSLSRENKGIVVSVSKKTGAVYLKISEEAFQRITKDADTERLSIGIDGIRVHFKPDQKGFKFSPVKGTLITQYKTHTKVAKLKTFFEYRVGTYIIKYDTVKKLYYAEMPMNL